MATNAKAETKGASATPTTGTTTTKDKKRVHKVIKGSPAKTDAKNIKDTVTKIVESNREVKYIYPPEIKDDQLGKKKFRANARAEEKKHLKAIADSTKGIAGSMKLDKAEQAHRKFRKATYLVP